jgi:DNA-binding NarL/FixJ family response regulator
MFEATSMLVLAQALAAHGTALRQAGQRVAAREVLREARDRAARAQATALETAVADELLVAGARPRRVPILGIGSLTASERRVADLAAQGMSNREVAEALFLTRKTIELHLGNVYSKLNIHSRTQLPAALAADAD